MKLLALLASLSGVAWMAGFLTANQGWGNPPWTFIMTALVCIAAAAALFATAGSASRLPARLGILWLLTLAVAYIVLAPVGGGLTLVLAALTYGTVAFVLWLSIPLVVFSFVRQRSVA
ncbi:MAG TPA: hypothetical protein VGK18_15275 [Propionicimonas sp.]|jgi:hypothetical protein|uniref:hypothetical protein n=1 Tax=Propionicimonas sp. TaxID=1955623 RepID=UPI002F412237